MNTNSSVSAFLEEMAVLLELAGENPFRVRAYQKAAQAVEGLTREIGSIPQEGLVSIPGIGSKISSHITEILGTGSFSEFNLLKKKFPKGLLDMVKVQSIGPKRARFLFDNLGIDSVPKLKEAARKGKIRNLAGLGAKTERNILLGLESLQGDGPERMLYWKAGLLARELIGEIRKLGAGQVTVAGSLRRGKETVGDLDMLCTGRDIISGFVKLPVVERVISAGQTKASVRLKAGIQCDLRVVPKNSFGAALQYFTGSKEHNIALRELALSRGYTLNEYGLFRNPAGKTGKMPVASKTEEEIYSRLGLKLIPPELREGRGEINVASKNALPVLVKEEDILGELHNHTTWSDGANSPEEMARAAASMGWKWLALGDHSQAVRVANGLSFKDFKRSMKEISSLQRRFPDIRLMRAIELDILRDGRMDFSDGEIGEIGVVIGAVHSSMKMDEDAMTERILRAVRNPGVDVIAHLSGRLLGKRQGYRVDEDRVFGEAAGNRTAFEINGQPDRQDLSDVSTRKAVEMKVPIVLATDAHSAMQLQYMSQAVVVARRAGLEKKDVLNCLSYKELLEWLKFKSRSGGDQ